VIVAERLRTESDQYQLWVAGVVPTFLCRGAPRAIRAPQGRLVRKGHGENPFPVFSLPAPNRGLRRTENPRVDGSISSLAAISKSMVCMRFRVSPADDWKVGRRAGARREPGPDFLKARCDRSGSVRSPRQESLVSPQRNRAPVRQAQALPLNLQPPRSTRHHVNGVPALRARRRDTALACQCGRARNLRVPSRNTTTGGNGRK